MAIVGQLLDGKGRDVWSIAPNAPVIDALKLMADKGVGALVVVENGKMIGIFSERDYVRKVALFDKDAKKTPVKELMSENVVHIHEERPIEECMTLMTAKRVRHLPVMTKDHQTMVGVISIGDVVKWLVSDKDFLIQQLANYITGDR